MLIVALVVNRHARARLLEGLRGTALLQFCEQLDELCQLTRSSHVRAVILEPFDRDGTPTSPFVVELKQELCSVPIVAYFTMTSDLSTDVVAMVRAGVDSTVFLNAFDSAQVLRAAVGSAEARCKALGAIAEISPLVPTGLVPLVEYCMANATRSLSVLELARAHGMHRKTLTNHFVRAGFLAPSTTIAWCRLIVAADRIMNDQSTIERTALDLEYPSAGALRSMLKRYVGVRPQQLRAMGGAKLVLEKFKKAISDAQSVMQSSPKRQRLMAG